MSVSRDAAAALLFPREEISRKKNPSPLVGEGGAKRRMRNRSILGSLAGRQLEAATFPDPSSALRAPSPARGEGGAGKGVWGL